MHTRPLNPIYRRDNSLARHTRGIWLCNEGAGNKVYDWSGRNNHGTMRDMSPDTGWINSQFGKVLNFDGSNDLVDMGTSADFDFITTGDKFSLEVWVYPKGVTSDVDAWFIAKGRPTSSTFSAYSVGYFESSGTAWRNRIRYWGSMVNTPGDEFTLNTWHHVVGVFELGGNAYYYRNGKLLRTQDISAQGVVDTTGGLFGLGAIPRTTTAIHEPFEGYMAKAAVYSKSLTRDEIGRLYSDPFWEFTEPQRFYLFTQSGGTTDYTSTRPGNSRLIKSFTSTRGGNTRLIKDITSTRGGNTDLIKDITSTRPGNTRLQQSFSATRPGNSRLNQSFTATRGGNTRLIKDITSTRGGNTRLIKDITSTRGGNTRLIKSFTDTKPGNTRLIKSLTSTVGGNTRLIKNIESTRPGNTRLIKSISSPRGGNTRLQQSFSTTKPGNTRLQQVFSSTRGGNSRLLKAFTTTKGGNTRLIKSLTNTRPGNTRLIKTLSSTISGNTRLYTLGADVRPGNTRLIKSISGIKTGNTRLTQVFTSIRGGNTRLKKLFTSTKASNSRLIKVFTVTKAGNTRIKKAFSETRGGNSNLTTSNFQIGGRTRIIPQPTIKCPYGKIEIVRYIQGNIETIRKGIG